MNKYYLYFIHQKNTFPLCMEEYDEHNVNSITTFLNLSICYFDQKCAHEYMYLYFKI